MKHLYLCVAGLWLGLFTASPAAAQKNSAVLAKIPGGGVPPVGQLAEESPWSRVVDSLLLPLNKAQIPSGILYDRALPLAGLQAFGRVQADTSSASHLLQAHLELYMSAYNRSTFRFTPSRLRARAETLARHDSVPLAVLDYQFHQLDTLAAQDNLIQFQNGRYYDVAGRSRSPYWQRDVVLVTPVTDAVNANTRFYFDPQLILGNQGRGISHLVVDFGNGAPPVVCVPGQLIPVQYPSPGQKVIHLTVWFTDGTQATAQAALTVRGLAVALRSEPVPLPDIKASVGFSGYDGSGSLRGAGEALAVLHNEASLEELDNGQRFKLRRPVIFMDGFDPGDKSGLQGPPNGEDKSLLQQLQEAGIIAGLEGLQRDLVILNFPKGQREFTNNPGSYTPYDVDGGADYIERNAFVLIELLNQLKGRLLPGEQYTVIGPSMGGLISRYALAYMEKMHQQDPTNPYWEHNTDVWLSFDSPHQGANVPLADQHYLNYYKNIAESAKSNLENKIQSPAARQMLLAYYDSYGPGRTPEGASGFRDRFMLALRDNGEAGSLGYPVNLRRVALVNGRLDGGLSPDGSLCGTAFNMNAKLRFWNAVLASVVRTFFIKKTRSNTVTESTARFTAGPNNSCDIFTGILNTVGWGINLGSPPPSNIRTVVSATSTAAGSYDLAPGGWYDTQKQLKDQSEGGAHGEKYAINVTDVRPNHTFIPTVSALGFQYQSMSSYQSTASLPNPYTNLLGRDLTCTQEIPFDSYYGPENENTKHIVGLNAGMGGFLLMELAKQTPAPVFLTTPAAICPNAATQFAVKEECTRAGRPGTTYTWTAAPGVHFELNGQPVPQLSGVNGPQTVYADAGFIGPTSVTVTATRQGYQPSTPVEHQFTVNYGYVDVEGPAGPVCYNSVVGFTATGQNATGPFTWSVYLNGQLSNNLISRTTPTQVFVRPDATGQLQVVAVATDNCRPQPNQRAEGTGLVTVADRINGRSCGALRPDVTMYPNPADGQVELTTNEAGTNAGQQRSTAAAPPSAPAEFEATLYDGQGRPLQSGRSTQGHLRWNTHGLLPGLYHVQVRQGTRTSSLPLSIQR